MGNLKSRGAVIENHEVLLNNLEIDKKQYKKLSKKVNKYSKTTFLDISSNAFGPKGAKYTAQAIAGRKLPKLKGLDLSDNDLGDAGLTYFAMAYSSPKTQNALEYINLANTHFSPKGLRFLLDSIMFCKKTVHLESLALSNNQIGDDVGCLAISKLLYASNVKLSELDLSWNNIFGEAMEALIDAIESSDTLEWLDLSGNLLLGDYELVLLSEALQNNGSLKELNLNYCSFSEKGLKVLANALILNNSLDHLHVEEFETNNTILLHEISTLAGEESKNHKTDEFISKIRQFQEQDDITKLAINETNGTIPRIAHLVAQILFPPQFLFEAQQQRSKSQNFGTDDNNNNNNDNNDNNNNNDNSELINLRFSNIKKLNRLFLTHNKLRATDIRIIVDAIIKAGKIVTTGELSSNDEESTANQSAILDDISSAPSESGDDISEASTRIDIADAMLDIPLAELVLSSNELGTSGCFKIARLLENGIPLRVLNLSHNNIASAGARVVLKALRSNHVCQQNIEVINLSHNHIGAEGAKAVLHMIEEIREQGRMSSLKELYLNHNRIPVENTLEIMHQFSRIRGHSGISLRVLHIFDNDFERITFSSQRVDDRMMNVVGEFLQHDHGVHTLRFDQCSVADEGLRYLGEQLMMADLKNQMAGLDMEASMAEMAQQEQKRMERRRNSLLSVGEPMQRMIGFGSGLKSIELVDLHVTLDGMQNIAGILSVDKKISQFTLSHLNGPGATDMGFVHIVEALEQNQGLTSISLSNNEECFTIPVMQKLAASLEVNERLERLRIDNCGIEDDAMVEFWGCLKRNQTLKTLNIAYNRITSQGLKDIPSVGNPIETMVLSFNNIGEEGSKAISDWIDDIKCKLRNLICFDAKIPEKGIALIGDSMETNKSLELVNLGRNKIGDEGAELLAKGLKRNKYLQELTVYDCNIGSKGAIALSQVISSGGLKELDLSSNIISNDGAYSIGQSLRDAPNLIRLSLNSNRIGESGAIQLSSHLCHNRVLSYLDVSANPIHDAGVMSFAVTLKMNHHLRLLHLAGCGISDQTIKALEPFKSSVKNTVQLKLITNK